MQLRRIWDSNDGVVGIVVAVLLIGLLVSMVSILQLYYVPAWMEEREAEHIEQVLTQFSELKFAIDTQSATNQTNSPIATSITLGSKELPFLMSLRAFGSLEITTDKISISFSNETHYLPYNLGIIRYTSANAYYIPDEKQSFIYEAGAIITNQTSGNSISIKPSFKPVEDYPFYEIFFNIVNVSGISNKVSWGGYDTIPIQTEYYGYILETMNDIRYINFNTSHPNAWKLYLNSTLKNENFIYGDDYDYKIIDKNKDDNQFSIKFLMSPGYCPKLELKVIDIFAQIGPGWVE